MKLKLFVFPKKGILDPENEVIKTNLKNLGYKLDSVNRGKFFFLDFKDLPKESIENFIENDGKKMFVNSLIEDFSYEIINN